MAEYILKDKLILDCKKRIANDWNNMVAPLSWAQAEKKFLKILEEAKTEDVAPVRHGRWKRKQSVYAQTGYIDVCSVCNGMLEHIGQKTSYCPNCGAKMDDNG